MTDQVEHREDRDLRTQLMRECVGMAKFALGGGKAIPPSAVATIEAASLSLERNSPESAAGGRVAGRHGPASKAQGVDIRTLVAVHERLSQIVAPATPQAILLLGSQADRAGAGNFLGPVPLVRRMMIAALLSLGLFIGLALFPEVTGDIAFQDAEYSDLLLNLLFLMAAAGLGATFAALFQVNRFIAEASYDPKFEASYWIRFVLGLIAGIILAQLVPIGEIPGGGSDISPGDSSSLHEGIGRLAKPTLALLGGFSAAVVYRFLNRMVAAVDTLVRGETREILAAQEQATKARLAQQAAQSRMAMVWRLIALQQHLNDGVAGEVVKAEVAEILNEFMGPDLSPSAPEDDRPGDPKSSDSGTIAPRPPTKSSQTGTAAGDPHTRAVEKADG